MCKIMHPGSSPIIDFQTDPSHYRHWRIEPDGDVAYLIMDVDLAGGHARGGVPRISDRLLSDTPRRRHGPRGDARAFFLRQPLTFVRRRRLPAVDLVRMRDGEDYLLGPVAAGMCSYRDLIDGSLTLVDIARMNEALDVKAENEARVIDAASKKD